MSMPLPHREHLIIPWLRQGESTMVFAAPGVGKSLFALDIALSVAGGGKCLGLWQTGPYMKEKRDEEAEKHDAPNVGESQHDASGTTDVPPPTGWKVLYVDGEMPLDDIRDRAAMLARGKAARRDEGFSLERAGRNLHFMARHHQKDVLADFVDLADHDSRCALLERIQGEGIDLVILDNLSTLAAFEDENAASSFNGPIDFLQRLKSGKTACLLVHHTNKGGEEFRGSSRIATTFETLVLLKAVTPPPFHAETQDEGDDSRAETATSAFMLEWRKFRGRRDESVRDGIIFTLTATMAATPQDEAQDSTAVWKLTDRDAGAMWQMLEMVRNETCTTQKELADALHISPPTLTRLKQRAMQEGRITNKEWTERMKAAEAKRQAQPMEAEVEPEF